MNIIKIIYFVVLIIFTPVAAYQYNLAICAIFQNEARFLKEWLEFNILIGVEHFYLYNNYSTDNYAEILKPYIDAGIVDCINWPYSQEGCISGGVEIAANQILFEQHCTNSIPGRVRGIAQVLAYNHCLDNTQGKVKWLIFIDIDEFLFPVKCNSLQEFLKNYEEFGAVCATWIHFGTSNIDHIPDNTLLIESLVMREIITEQTQSYVKSIVQPDKVKTFHIHTAIEFYPNYFQVNPDKIKFNGPCQPVSKTTDKLRINHYWTRDKQFLYDHKIARQYFFNKNYTKKWVLQQAASMNKEKDLTIQKYLPALKKIMLN